MATEIFEGSYKGHAIYYYRYQNGGVYRASEIDGTFSTYNAVKAAIDEVEGVVYIPPSGPQGPPESGLVQADIYHEVVIYQRPETGEFVFTINGIVYTSPLDIIETRLRIDGILGIYEPAPTTPPAVIELPWGFGWVADVLNWLKTLFDNTFGSLSKIKPALDNAVLGMQQSADSAVTGIGKLADSVVTPIESLPAQIWMEMLNKFGEFGKGLVTPLQDAGKSALDAAITASSEHSPDPETKKRIEDLLEQLRKRQQAAIESIRHSEIDPGDANNNALALAVELLGTQLAIGLAGALIDVLHPIKNVNATAIAQAISETIGFRGTISDIIQMPARTGVIPFAQRYWNAQYTPAIPSYQDLINQVVKEVIPIDEFKKQMSYLGYNEGWSQRIWDAHFIAPNLNDILTAWRRGLITEAEVDRLMILVDLDPRFKEIFDTRKYIDPPLSVTRFMYEEGVITPGQVREYVALQGYRPEHVDNITKYITEFQERLWRRRYLTTLSSGYIKGVYASGDLQKAVVDAGYSEGVASWIVANADARKKIEAAQVTTEKPKLLGIGDVKNAYLRNLIDAAKLRTDLSIRGYPYDEVELLIKVLDEQKVVSAAGGRKVALSESELITAWQFSKITEPRLRIELTTRGLTSEEIDILEATKLAMWAAGGKPSPEEEMP